MSHIPCLLCPWAVSFDAHIPGRREHARELAFRHYMTHSGAEDK